MLTDQQKSYILIAYQNGTVVIRDFTSSYPLVQDGTLLRVSDYVFELTDDGKILGKAIKAEALVTLDGENDIALMTDDDVFIIVEDGTPESTWRFTYTVTYPRFNRDDWCFDWAVEASGLTTAEAEVDADVAIATLFPGATIG